MRVLRPPDVSRSIYGKDSLGEVEAAGAFQKPWEAVWGGELAASQSLHIPGEGLFWKVRGVGLAERKYEEQEPSTREEGLHGYWGDLR